MSTKLSSDERLRRLLSAVPWISEEEGPTVEEVCARFGYSDDELADDLNLLFVCGVYPFTPDSLMEAEIYDGRVWIRYADYFARPLRLTPAEALAVLAAGRGLLGSKGADENGALARSLDKLASALGVDPEETLEVDLGSVDHSLLDQLKAATDNHRCVRFSYYSFGRDEWNERLVEPYDVYSTAGEWYVLGFDRDKGAQRLFRVDRMRSLELTNEVFGAPPSQSRVIYQPSAEDPVVTLEVTRENWWISDYYPTISAERIDNDVMRVKLSISGQSFLERLLLRLGASTKVSGADSVASNAASRVLAIYSS